MRFTTPDHDNDAYSGGNCADFVGGGGWWYRECMWSSLNGLYLAGEHATPPHGMCWNTYRGDAYSMKTTVMQIKRLN